jgi:hypothetical protein
MYAFDAPSPPASLAVIRPGSVKLTCLRIATAMMLLTKSAFAYAGPCTANIARVEQQIQGSQVGPSGPQTIDAQLGRQPTPSMLGAARQRAAAMADAAVQRAHNADASGDLAACQQALDELKDIYGIE